MDTEEDVFTVIYLIGALVALVLLIPPKYDPAIRIREWLDGKER